MHVQLDHEGFRCSDGPRIFLTQPLMLDHAQDEAEAIINRMKASSDGATHIPPSCYDFGTPTDANVQEATSGIVNMSSGVNERVFSDSINDGNDLDTPSREQELVSSKSGLRESYVPTVHRQTPRRENELSLCSMDEYMNIDSFNTGFYPQDELGLQRGIDEETGSAILGPVTRFSSAIFRTQAETLVMASVAADYIAWLRKAPPGGGVPNVSESPVYLGMLDNLEIRLRELCEMSQSRSMGALRELVTDLGALAPLGGAMAARLGGLEEDLQKEARERAEVFRSRYNPCTLLSDQARSTSG